MIWGRLSVTRRAKPEALSAAAAALHNLTSDLTALGGAPLTVATSKTELTWSAHSATTHDERDYDPASGRSRPTGRVVASVDLSLNVRAFGLLGPLGEACARHASFNIDGVSWHVDDDNPAWAEVRAAAVESAIRKGHDYAHALGGSLTSIEHIADAGLLGGTGDGVPAARSGARMLASAGGAPDDLGTPSLDPVPQELTAVIEARLTATAAPVTGT